MSSFSVYRCPGCEQFVIEDSWSFMDDVCVACAEEVNGDKCQWCKHTSCHCDADRKEYLEERDIINSLDLDRDVD